jgi:predicted flap endonuclease-1-like 5' DNA nuclease
MLKKLRKTLSKEIKNRYEKMEGRYLGLENRIYTTIEDRLTLLESKFDDLSELIKDEVRFRKERNEDKLEDIDQEDDGSPFSETVEEVKEIIDEKIKDTKEKVKEAKEVVSEKVEEARKMVTSKLKKGKKAKAKAEKKVEKKVKEAAKKIKEVAEEIENNDLTMIKGLGDKMAEKLIAEGITSFQQLAKMTEKDVNALDEKIKSFAARFKRYEWDKQAKEQ